MHKSTILPLRCTERRSGMSDSEIVCMSWRNKGVSRNQREEWHPCIFFFQCRQSFVYSYMYVLFVHMCPLLIKSWIKKSTKKCLNASLCYKTLFRYSVNHLHLEGQVIFHIPLIFVSIFSLWSFYYIQIEPWWSIMHIFYTVVSPHPWFGFLWFQLPVIICLQKLMIPLLTSVRRS